MARPITPAEARGLTAKQKKAVDRAVDAMNEELHRVNWRKDTSHAWFGLPHGVRNALEAQEGDGDDALLQRVLEEYRRSGWDVRCDYCEGGTALEFTPRRWRDGL